jgi:hypothetical protein
MALPTDFHFSQGSLQDYVDCPRRFQLRYLLQVAWPAIESEPVLENERYVQQGAAFHRLAHQHALGIPADQLSAAVQGTDLRRWWRHYLESGPAQLPPSRVPEIVLSTPLGGYRLLAKYDLVAVDIGERAVIVDWKTSRRRPSRAWLAERQQTRVYPYVLVRAGEELNGGQQLAPEQVRMVYWFADYPADAETFPYDTATFDRDEDDLASLIEEIASLNEAGFALTSDEALCRFCPYRSLCQRGVQAGDLNEPSDEAEGTEAPELFLDFEQIAEIEY